MSVTYLHDFSARSYFLTMEKSWEKSAVKTQNAVRAFQQLKGGDFLLSNKRRDFAVLHVFLTQIETRKLFFM